MAPFFARERKCDSDEEERAAIKVKAQRRLNNQDQVAQQYYDSDDAFAFYKEVWGGENIHVGIYEGEAFSVPLSAERVKIASQKSLETLLSKVVPREGDLIMDMGSAYGGCARYCAETYGCRVTCIDLSKRENETNVLMTKEAGLDHLITVPGERSFCETGEPDGIYDLVLSQDSFLHAGEHRAGAVAEASRVLKPGGSFIFTDIMQAENLPDRSVLSAVYARIHLKDMGDVAFYTRAAAAAGMELVEFDDRTYELANHYSSILKVLQSRAPGLVSSGKVSEQYINNMTAGLQAWIAAASGGHLRWGYLHFKKSEEPDLTMISSPSSSRSLTMFNEDEEVRTSHT